MATSKKSSTKGGKARQRKTPSQSRARKVPVGRTALKKGSAAKLTRTKKSSSASRARATESKGSGRAKAQTRRSGRANSAQSKGTSRSRSRSTTGPQTRARGKKAGKVPKGRPKKGTQSRSSKAPAKRSTRASRSRSKASSKKSGKGMAPLRCNKCGGNFYYQDTNKPVMLKKKTKRPLTGYMAFVKENLTKDNMKGQRAPDVMKAIAARWRQMNDQQKQRYEKQAKAMNNSQKK